jgi:hypothetical protein
MRFESAGAVLVLTVMAGCADLAPTVKADVAPDEAVGYIGAAFSDLGTRGAGFGLGIVGPDGKDLVLSFGGPPVAGMVSDTHLGMIAVPPGGYQVRYLVTFSALREVTAKGPVSSPLSAPFWVKKGQVVFLGRFGATTTPGFKKTTFRLETERTRLEEAQAMLRGGYPRFAEAPVECLLCEGAPPVRPPTADPAHAGAGKDRPLVKETAEPDAAPADPFPPLPDTSRPTRVVDRP